MKLYFATNNIYKLKEVQEVVGDSFQIESMRSLGINEDIPEDQQTLEGNALQKARFLYDRTGESCFADDTGLEVDALNGAPGVYSARYAGDAKNSFDNMALLLKNMSGKQNRKARFRTVIALILDGKEYLFEGIVNGTIAEEPRGTAGFGYDPLFVPDGYSTTFAEMDSEAKNAISHRGRAVEKLAAFLLKR
ncbi:MAG TPA: non-canonical purine NTP diphosphatase [Candidatus Alistipes pullicola]|nr:non-canonical purine NTP diphosphatase [Candidatus Alistipes pullicola]